MTPPAPGPRTRGRWRPELADVADALVSLATTALGLGIAIAVVEDVGVSGPWPVIVAAAVVAFGDLVLRAPMRLLARSAGAAGALLVGLLAQVLTAWIALVVLPGISVGSAWGFFAVLVLTSVVMAVGRWLWGANDSEYVVADVLRRARRHARRTRGAVPDDGSVQAGLLVVQLDGVAEPVLREAIEAGLAPTMQRWIDAGTHTLEPWWARIPSTTPASQAGLLHGDSSAIPAFRWWDRELGRLVVTNHPQDAALVEKRLSTGDGLLAGGGTAVSTMFSGDAATSFLVMSRTRAPGPDGTGAGLGPGPAFLRFFASPFVLARAVSLTLGEMVKELYQARRQRVRDVLPRISRSGWYVVLRGLSNVAMRDLNTSLVAEAVVRGDPTIFVDLVDYDEIAHHAGPTRPESLRALEGLDRVLNVLERAVAVAPRAYRIVVVSDHGQTLGATFEQVEGRSLIDTVRALMAEPETDGVSTGSGEDWGPLNALLNSAFSSTRAVLGPDASPEATRARSGGDLPDVVVVGSGNLGLVWFPREPARQTLEDLQERWPGLVAGLAATASVGVVVVDTRERGLVAIGAGGLVLLESDAPPEGEDPLAGYGPRGRADVLRAARLPNTGDLLLVSRVTREGHVHAFEGQVGSHGGIGGAQNHALLLHPTQWAIDDDLREPVGDDEILVGAESVHVQLVRWAAAAGLRP
ncbi:alkaline phosphatase family protein [Cellulomonas rhizosphaerae]|uniref:Phosphodiesterase n=1 Tax=Cellulomonas rhizosphaerae TaxID=2293719 RepID=A0A413RQR5_9CELL|nr:alkaline phosphatase family protein [Cellulomonas rhizosphaerae]RHA44287.1 phosphodiesterase [Cellulomonas rhizosphaerae]